LTLPAAVLFTLTACTEHAPLAAPDTKPAASALAPAGNRLATIEWQGATPVLYVQNPDGSERVRVRFDHVSDHVTGNYSPRLLPVTDESIRRFANVKWSPDGRYLAVMLAVATDALEIVLVSADGRALRTISPNSQYLWGDVDWSADSRRITYIMATGPFGRAADIFTTELGRDLVTRVTTGMNLSGYDAVRFDASGQNIWFTQHTGWAPDQINVASRIASVDLNSGAITYGDPVIGEPQGFARDGSFALFIRTDPATSLRELVRRPLDGSAETVLATGNFGDASIIEGDQQAVLSSWDRSGSMLSFDVIGLGRANDILASLKTDPTAAGAVLKSAL
jgi:dipeptidyl aminopeptidase/acylaminoacyl peptidase